MTTFTETIQLGKTPIVVPIYFKGRKLPADTKPTAVAVHYAQHDCGVLIHQIGMRGAREMPYGYQDANLSIRDMFEKELDCVAASKLAKIFHHSGMKPGPTVFVMEGGFGPQILRSLTPLLVPDRLHMEDVMDGLVKAHLPSDLIHWTVAKVTDVRAQARFIEMTAS